MEKPSLFRRFILFLLTPFRGWIDKQLDSIIKYQNAIIKEQNAQLKERGMEIKFTDEEKEKLTKLRDKAEKANGGKKLDLPEI